MSKKQKPSFPTIPSATISQEFVPEIHMGIDFKVPLGSEVYAVLDGRVIEADDEGRTYGQYIAIEHQNGYVSLYAHLSEFKIKEGDKVKSGQLIALSGGDINDDIKDGSSSGPHLHLEIRPREYTDSNLYNIDPLEYLISFLKVKSKTFYTFSYTGLNVRTEPDIKSSIIYVLFYGKPVEIVEEKNGWSRINSLRPEWVMSKYLKIAP